MAASNRTDSIKKLHEIIHSAARSMIVNPTSEEQKSKVKGLIKREAARRKSEKIKKSAKKENRKKGGWE
jgi:peptidyl-tRNA hydrolase ICT1